MGPIHRACVDTLSCVEIILSCIAIVVSIVALVWSAIADRNQRRRDLILDSLARLIANSKKLTHEDRKGFESLDDSVDRGPLRIDLMRQHSDQYRNEVGIEYVLLKAFGDGGVEAAAYALYEAHRQARRAIWHTECGDKGHDCSKVEGTPGTLWRVGEPADHRQTSIHNFNG